MNKQLQYLALAACTLWLGGCATNSIKQSWKSPAYKGGPVQKIAILAVDERGIVRQALENRFVNQFRAQGQGAIFTHELLDLREIKGQKEAATAQLRNAGADAVLIVRLVDQATYATETRATPELFTPTITGYGGYGSYGLYGWHDYYSVAFTDMGVIWGSTTQNIYLDSTLFDLKTGQRLWSALTLTVIKEDADRLVEADSLVAMVVKKLGKDGLIRN